MAPVREGRVLRWTGFTLVVAGLIATLALRFAGPDSGPTWLYFAPGVALVAGAAVAYRGKQRAALARSRLLAAAADQTPPVIYLRPFAADEPGWRLVLGAVLTVRAFTPVLSLEEQLADAVAPFGPLVGIGQPGESLPKPGALRSYPEDWREDVEQLLARARLVIVRPGRSQGLLWEIQRVFRMVSPERVLLLVSRGDRQAYAATRTAVAQACGAELPAFTEVRRGAFIEFGAGWSPRILRLKVPLWRSSPLAPMKCRFNHALAPVFSRFALPWQASPVSALTVVALALPALLLTGAAGLAIATFVDSGGDQATVAQPALTTAATQLADSGAPGSAPATAAAAGAQVREVAGVRLAISGEPEPADVPLSDEYRARVESARRYDLQQDGLQVVVIHTLMKPGFSPSVLGSARGALEGLRHAQGISSVTSSLDSTEVSGRPAVRTRATALADGQTLLLRSLTFSDGRSLWAVQVVVPPGADSAEGDRILASASLPEGRIPSVRH